MKVIEPGHIYEFNWLDIEKISIDYPKDRKFMESHDNKLVFVNREFGTEHPGTQTQEVLRALIDRTQHCDNCLRWNGNDDIIFHLRMALALHEARAIERKTEKGYIKPELILTDSDGHFKIGERKND